MKLNLSLREKAIIEKHGMFPARVVVGSEADRELEKQGTKFDEFGIGRLAVGNSSLPVILVPAPKAPNTTTDGQKM